MNAWSRMNDPREAQQWESTGTLTAVAPYNEPEMRQRLDDVLRRSARLLALTVDRNRTPNAKPDSLFHRGWGRAPLWAHYAGAHRGVCLVLDPAVVSEALDDRVPFTGARHRFWGRIEYADQTKPDRPRWGIHRPGLTRRRHRGIHRQTPAQAARRIRPAVHEQEHRLGLRDRASHRCRQPRSRRERTRRTREHPARRPPRGGDLRRRALSPEPDRRRYPARPAQIHPSSFNVAGPTAPHGSNESPCKSLDALPIRRRAHDPSPATQRPTDDTASSIVLRHWTRFACGAESWRNRTYVRYRLCQRRSTRNSAHIEYVHSASNL